MSNNLTPSQDSLVSAIAEVLESRDLARIAKSAEDSKSDLKLFKGIVRVKDIVMALVFFGSLLYGAFVTFDKLESKPDLPTVTKAIEDRIIPIRDVSKQNQDAIGDLKADVEVIDKMVDRQGDVLDYVMESQSWQGEVLEHVANKQHGKAPKRPQSLKIKEQELMSQ